GGVAAGPAPHSTPTLSTRQRREGSAVDRRRPGHEEDRDPLRNPAGRAVPRSAAGSRAVPAGAASDGPNGVAARVGVASTNQEESVRVGADPAVAGRLRAV